MRDLIKKILKESTHISKDAPDWVHTFHVSSREDRIAQIEKNKIHIKKLIPKIFEFFEDKFGNNLVRIIMKERGTHYGNESYTTNKIVLDFRFSDNTPNVIQSKREVLKDLTSFFNIDVTYYGTPLEVEFHKAVWEKF
jgi:hypothetical protein